MSTCTWPGENEIMKEYHDQEWCVPSFEDNYIFEMLILEGAQAGLSWSIILAKREEYRRALHGFDIIYCSKLTDEELEVIRDNYNIIKNKAKLRAVRSNALAVLELQREFGSLSSYLWRYVEGRPVINHWSMESQMPAQSELSELMSRDLKKRGFKFVGPVILYSFMQAIGMVDDHIHTCPCHTKNRQ